MTRRFSWCIYLHSARPYTFFAERAAAWNEQTRARKDGLRPLAAAGRGMTVPLIVTANRVLCLAWQRSGHARPRSHLTRTNNPPVSVDVCVGRRERQFHASSPAGLGGFSPANAARSRLTCLFRDAAVLAAICMPAAPATDAFMLRFALPRCSCLH